MTIVRTAVVHALPTRALPEISTNVVLLLLGALTGYLAGTIEVDLPRWVAWLGFGILVVLFVLTVVWKYRLDRPVKREWGDGSPYPGLKAFTAAESSVFFGRDEEIAQLRDRLNAIRVSEARRFVAIIGSSGAGKSSLVRAGLLPRLGGSSPSWITLPPVIPGKQPWDNLGRSIASVLPDVEIEVAALARELSENAQALVRRLEEVRAAARDRFASIVLTLDQAEELLTQNPGEWVGFLETMRDALREDSRLWVVATLRSEFLTGFLEEGFEDLFHSPVVIGRLSREKLFEVIEKPGELAGITLERGVVDRLVSEVQSADALPLLAYALEELYSRLDGRTEITLADYEQIGGVTGALPKHAEQACAHLKGVPGAAPVLDTLLRFVTFARREDGSISPTRRRQNWNTLTDPQREVVQAFIDARLLTRDQDMVGVAHEALFDKWQPLAEAIAAKRPGIQRLGELERSAEAWRDNGRQDSYLLRGDRLQEATRSQRDHGDLASDPALVKEFLDRSLESDQTELEKIANSVAQRALSVMGRDPELALLLAVAAVEEGMDTPAARAALTAVLTRSRLRGVLYGHSETVRAAAWSPDGTRIATGSEDGTVRIWRPDTREEPEIEKAGGPVRSLGWSQLGDAIAAGLKDGRVWMYWVNNGHARALKVHDAEVNAVAWGANGRVATASHDNTARVWDARTGKDLRAPLPHPAWVRGVCWCPEGRRLVTACRDRKVRMWDLGTDEQEPRIIDAHDDWVENVAWSPDGRWLATVSKDRRGRIWDAEGVWDAEGGEELATLRGHKDWVQGIDWSPDSERVATCSRDRTCRTWHRSGRELAVLHGHRHWAHRVSWSPIAERLVTASYDSTARIWDAHAASAVATLRNHADVVQAVAWSPDDRRIATASHDGTARVTDLETGEEWVLPHEEGTGVYDVAWSPDGTRIVTGCGDNNAHIWDWERCVVVDELRGHQNWVEYVAWSPNGEYIATGSNDETARIWRAADGKDIVSLPGHRKWVRGVAWSPDSSRVATASYDHTARIWDLAAPDQPLVLVGHEQWVNAVAWSPNGERMATASVDLTTRIWDTATDDPLPIKLEGHDDSVQSVAWSRDGRRIATASSDGTARTWDATTYTALAVPCVREASVYDVAWSRDGQRLATASDDGAVHVWDATERGLDELLAMARERCFRELKPEERRSAMLRAPAEKSAEVVAA